jgi:hypothetical protein
VGAWEGHGESHRKRPGEELKVRGMMNGGGM